MIEQKVMTPGEEVRQVGRWKRYESYKESGIEWVNTVPITWKVQRLKTTILSIQNGIWGEEPTRDEKDIVCIRVADFDRLNHKVSDKNLTIRSVSFNQKQSRIINFGDLLIEKSGGGDLQPVGTVVFYNLQIPAVCSNFIAKIQVTKDNDARFLCYLHSILYELRINVASIKQNTGIQNLDSDGYLKELVPLPAIYEQQLIAAFLDRETTKINALIAKRERMIELLQERRTAVINQAVTRGLNPAVKMKDSGVEWLGEIPEQWEVRKLKYLATFLGGGTPSKANTDYWNGKIPWVSPKDMKTDIITDTEDHITLDALKESTTNFIQPGAVLIVVRSGILRHSIPVAINQLPVTINQDIKAIMPRNALLPEYLAAVIKSHQEVLLVEWRKSGATVESIEYELLINTRIAVPPQEEQKSIVEMIQGKTAPIDKLISGIERSIQKLKEYKVALISAAVTGQIDVRGEVDAPPTQSAEDVAG